MTTEDISGSVDPEIESLSIVQAYLTGLAHVRQLREAQSRQLLPGAEWDAKYGKITEREIAVDEAFAGAVTYWKSRPTKSAKQVLWRIVDRLKNRHDMTPHGKSLVDRLKREIDVV